MNIVNVRGEPEPTNPGDQDQEPRTGSTTSEHPTAPRQATWFGVSEPAALPPGPFAGVVFNRPIDQVLSYHVPEPPRA